MRRLALAAALAALAVPAAAQRAYDPECSESYRGERCAALRLRAQREAYRLAPIEREQGRFAQIRRIYYVDGGTELGVISVTRARAGAVRLTFQRAWNRGRPTQLTAILSEAAWQELLTRSAQFERGHVPTGEGWPGRCQLDERFYMEASDGARARRAAGPDCSESSPAAAYANWFAELALAQFPGCAQLEDTADRTAIWRLWLCDERLRGELMAAAEVSNALLPFSVEGEEAALPAAFAERVSLDWRGERSTGRDAVVARWLRAGAEEPFPQFLVRTIHGESADRVRVEAVLNYDGGPPELCIGNPLDAPVAMIWQRGPDGRFSIRQISVGPYLSRYLRASR